MSEKKDGLRSLEAGLNLDKFARIAPEQPTCAFGPGTWCGACQLMTTRTDDVSPDRIHFDQDERLLSTTPCRVR
jgi:hypothetical protein